MQSRFDLEEPDLVIAPSGDEFELVLTDAVELDFADGFASVYVLRGSTGA